MGNLDRARRGRRPRRRGEIVDRSRDQRVLGIRAQGHVETEIRGQRIQVDRDGVGAALDLDRGVFSRGTADLDDSLNARGRDRIEHWRRQRTGILDCRVTDEWIQRTQVDGKLEDTVIQDTGVDTAEGYRTAVRVGGERPGAFRGTALVGQRDEKLLGSRGAGAEQHLAGYVGAVAEADDIVSAGAEDWIVGLNRDRRQHVARNVDLGRRLVGIVAGKRQDTRRCAASGPRLRHESQNQALRTARRQHKGNILPGYRPDLERRGIADNTTDFERRIAGIAHSKLLFNEGTLVDAGEQNSVNDVDVRQLCRCRQHAVTGHGNLDRVDVAGVAIDRNRALENSLGRRAEINVDVTRRITYANIEAGRRKYAERRAAAGNITNAQGRVAGILDDQRQARRAADEDIAEIERIGANADSRLWWRLDTAPQHGDHDRIDIVGVAVDRDGAGKIAHRGRAETNLHVLCRSARSHAKRYRR